MRSFLPSLGCGGGYGLQGTYEIGREQQGGGGRGEEEGESRVMVPERAEVFLPLLLFLLPSFSQDKCAKNRPPTLFVVGRWFHSTCKTGILLPFVLKGAVDRIFGLSTVVQKR